MLKLVLKFLPSHLSINFDSFFWKIFRNIFDIPKNFPQNFLKFSSKPVAEGILIQDLEPIDCISQINSDFSVILYQIVKRNDYITEIVVKSKLLAKSAKLGHIFKLQSYKNKMEGVPVTALEINQEKGLITCIIVEMGASSRMVKNFKLGEPLIFMGPSGKEVEIPKNETVVMIGAGRGNVILPAIASAYKKNGCKIIFFAGYLENSYVVMKDEMEIASDILILSIENEVPNLKLNRPQDLQCQGKITSAIIDFFRKNDEKIDRIFTIGNHKMMKEIYKIRASNLIENFSLAPIAITNLNAPMQCMLKGVCSQCLQKKIDENGCVEYFYACASQDQDMDKLDFKHLEARCEQNSLLEKMARFEGLLC
jgi:NAD(P)H-flavin reductase